MSARVCGHVSLAGEESLQAPPLLGQQVGGGQQVLAGEGPAAQVLLEREARVRQADALPTGGATKASAAACDTAPAPITNTRWPSPATTSYSASPVLTAPPWAFTTSLMPASERAASTSNCSVAVCAKAGVTSPNKSTVRVWRKWSGALGSMRVAESSVGRRLGRFSGADPQGFVLQPHGA